MLTIRSDDHGEHGSPAVRLPREGFLEHRRIAWPAMVASPNAPTAVACATRRRRGRGGGRVEVHAPRPDPPVLVPRPQQPVSPVHGDAERGRRGHALAERRALLVAAPRACAPPGEHLVERPHPDPGLGPGPELPPLRLRRQRAEERPRLRLPERVRPHLERGRARRVHGGAERHAEDALPAAGADVLRQRPMPAAVLRHGALERHGPIARAPDGAARAGGVGGAGVVVVLRLVSVRRERGVVPAAAGVGDARGGVVVDVVEGVGGREDVVVVEAVVAERGAPRRGGVARERLAVGDPAALRRLGARHRRGHLPQRLVVGLHGDRWLGLGAWGGMGMGRDKMEMVKEKGAAREGGRTNGRPSERATRGRRSRGRTR